MTSSSAGPTDRGGSTAVCSRGLCARSPRWRPTIPPSRITYYLPFVGVDPELPSCRERSSATRGRPPEHLFTHRNRGVGVVGKQAIDPELVIHRKLGRLVAAGVEEFRAALVAYAEVRCKEVVLRTESEWVQEQPDAMGVMHQPRRLAQRIARSVASHDAALVRADAVRVAGDLAEAMRRDEVVVR